MFKTNVGILSVIISFALFFLFFGCKNEKKMIPDEGAYKIIFLHHSTGRVIWEGKPEGLKKITGIFSKVEAVPDWFETYNETSNTNYFITEQDFPRAKPYGWHNYPYDYYNIWVKNAGTSAYQEEPTLEMLTQQYDLIIFKHCFPVGNIVADADSADIGSSDKTLSNYKAQYRAIKEKLLQFPENRFLLWTPAALTEAMTTPEEAQRTREFAEWVKNEWDTVGDNIFLWDFYELETEGGQYLNPEYAVGKNDSHPSKAFAAKASPLFCQRIVDIIETNGQKTSLTGETK